MKNYYFDQNLSQCRKFITVMKIYYGDENYHQFIKLRVRDLLMNLINLMDTVLEIYHPGEKLII